MDDVAVYDMICNADTIGVFQIESRAQMSMLPRLRPRNYYDLVIEVAIVRPGPIQGDMVHPYLRRRSGAEPVVFPSEAVRGVLARTCGVPIFQEQVMQLAVVAADFTPGEADQLRRSMAAWKRRGGVGHFEEKLIDGMRRNGYAEQFARQIVDQIRGFSEYGFPEAHAASFAVLAYVSAWLKHHHPAAFTAALLNSQPMGFYAPAQLLRDLRAHGIEVRSVDVGVSDVECTLEHSVDAEGEEHATGALALRLGLACARSLPQAAAQRVVAARLAPPFTSVADLGDRAAACHGMTWKCWRPAARWPGSRVTGTWRTGAWPVTCRRWARRPMRRLKARARCCARPPRPRTSSRTTSRWDSRWAGIRWRCCASACRRRGC